MRARSVSGTPHLRRVHKRLGIAAAVGMIWLAVTGLAILWSDNLGLPHTPVPNWVAKTYGSAATSIRLISSDGHAVEYDGRWRFDGHALAIALHAPSALFAGPGGLYYAVADDGVALIAADGTLVETVPAASLDAARLTRAGGTAARVCAGDAAIRCTTDSAEWKPADGNVPALMPVAAASPAPSLERLFLDLHAARFLGPMQKLFWTALAIVLLVLPWSGLRLAFRKRTPPAKGGRSKPARIVALEGRRAAGHRGPSE